MNIGELFTNFFKQMGFMQESFTWQSIVMVVISGVLIFLAVKKDFEPYLLIPIAVGMLLVNIAPGLIAPPSVADDGSVQNGGLLYYIGEGVHLGIFPPLIFLGIGATTDFGPLIASPKSLIFGAAAQIGIFITFLGALLLGFNGLEAASIGIIGGADGPTAIFLSTTLLKDNPEMVGIIAVVAYSYMALVPIIQPPIIKLLTTKKERLIRMEQTRVVSKRERIIFPIVIMLISILLVPSSAPLIGMLMLGNLIKESGVVPNLVNASAKTILYAVTIFLGVSVGTKAIGTSFLTPDSLKILLLGLIAFSVATATGVLFGKLMCVITKGKVNPMIGAAGVSAVPMAARVVHKLGQKEDPSNYLLMHAMGPNVAGVIGSAVAAGLLLGVFG